MNGPGQGDKHGQGLGRSDSQRCEENRASNLGKQPPVTGKGGEEFRKVEGDLFRLPYRKQYSFQSLPMPYH